MAGVPHPIAEHPVADYLVASVSVGALLLCVVLVVTNASRLVDRTTPRAVAMRVSGYL